MVVTLGQQYNVVEKSTVSYTVHLHQSPCRDTKQNENNVPGSSTQLNRAAIGAYSPEHNECYDIMISEEWYISVLQHVPREFLPYHIFGACLYFTLCVTFVRAGYGAWVKRKKEDHHRRYLEHNPDSRRYFQHAHFIPIVGVGMRGE